MNPEAQPSWISPDGVAYPLSGKGHSEFAYDILLNEKLGEHMSKKMPTDGSSEQKGESGEVAKANAMRELGDPKDPRHSEELCGRGWVQASDDGARMIIRAASMGRLKECWAHFSDLMQKRDAVVFAVGAVGSGVSAGLSRKDLLGPAESVLGRILEIVSGKVRDRSSLRWSSQGHGVKYFE
jgi:hypothetical protein